MFVLHKYTFPKACWPWFCSQTMPEVSSSERNQNETTLYRYLSILDTCQNRKTYTVIVFSISTNNLRHFSVAVKCFHTCKKEMLKTSRHYLLATSCWTVPISSKSTLKCLISMLHTYLFFGKFSQLHGLLGPTRLLILGGNSCLHY